MNHQPNSTPIYVGEIVVGYVSGGLFIKTVSRKEHFLHRPEAIAFSKDSLHQAEAAGATHVVIYERDRGQTFNASISLIWDKGFHVERSGFEPQIALPLRRWKKGSEIALQEKLF